MCGCMYVLTYICLHARAFISVRAWVLLCMGVGVGVGAWVFLCMGVGGGVGVGVGVSACNFD